MNYNDFIGILGIVVLFAIGLLLSNNWRAIRLRTVIGAFVMQFIIGALILYVPEGQNILHIISGKVALILNYGKEGVDFLFGALVSDELMQKAFGDGGYIFAFRILPFIIFFSSLITVLYYLGVMKWIIRIIGGILAKILGTSNTESMTVAANIFVGPTASALTIKPYINRMTESQLFTVMCGGLAAIDGSMIFAYSEMGIPMPYLLAAAFMTAPGTLLFAKLMMPETEIPEHVENVIMNEGEDKPTNIIDAAASGAIFGLKVAVTVGAVLLAFISLIAIFNGFVGWIGGFFGNDELTLQAILGFIFWPFAWVMGVPWSEAKIAGSLIGQKVVINEFIAYANYIDIISKSGAVISDKTQAIIAFSLCGFANFGSIAILVGGLGIIAPKRSHDIARLGIKALIASTFSNLISGIIAGIFISLSAATVLSIG